MKVTCLSVLLLPTSAAAYRSNRWLKTGDKDMAMSKGAKGMKGMGMKDKGMQGKAGCQSVKIKTSYAEVDAGLGQTAVGGTSGFPVYDYYTDEPIGTLTDQSTDILVGGQFTDCTVTGSFNFEFDASLEYPFVSQVMFSGSCLGDSIAITGGTGKYACASGSAIVLHDGADYVTVDLMICNTCA